MRRFLRLFACLCAVLTFCGCRVLRRGNDLTGFLARLHGRNETVAVESEGFLYDADRKKLLKFYPVGESTVEVSLRTDAKNRLTELWLVLPAELYGDARAIAFCRDCAAAFLNDEALAAELTGPAFAKTVTEPAPQTKKADAQGAGFSADVTENGSVLTFYFEE